MEDDDTTDGVGGGVGNTATVPAVVVKAALVVLLRGAAVELDSIGGSVELVPWPDDVVESLDMSRAVVVLAISMWEVAGATLLVNVSRSAVTAVEL